MSSSQNEGIFGGMLENEQGRTKGRRGQNSVILSERTS